MFNLGPDPTPDPGFLHAPDASDASATSGDPESENALQGYFDWQVTTLMLAYDLRDPVDARSPEAGEKRRRSVEEEVRKMTLAVVPDIYLKDPSLDWPPELMMTITRTTLLRAAEVAGLVVD
ncbi:MAG: hypothetical protein AAGG38_02525 [Planctomycetota bacterium]